MARSYQQGIYRPVHPEKVIGDVNNIVFRSSWERRLLQWLDHNPDVSRYSSEETVIPYRCKSDGKMHRYFLDFVIHFKSGAKLFVEVKPKAQTRPPIRSKGKTQNAFLVECLTWAKNHSKWEAAEQYARDNYGTFQVWTEDTLESLGINLNIGRYPVKKK